MKQSTRLLTQPENSQPTSQLNWGQTLIFNESYINNADMAGYFFGPNPVPQGEVLLLGDNRDDSVDSREFGTVSVDSITGRVLTHMWPLGGHD
jgi:signal peptidase I